MSAKRIGFDQAKIQSKGTTSEYLVYSHIGSFNSVLETLFSLGVDPETRRFLRVDDDK